MALKTAEDRKIDRAIFISKEWPFEPKVSKDIT
jgi:hypothetical protein